MATPGDGLSPTMFMFLWSGVTDASLTAGAASPPVGQFTNGPRNFDLSGEVVQVVDIVGGGATACGPVTDAVADIKVAHIDGQTAGQLEDAVSTAASTEGTRFRFNGDHYQFNLSTKGLSIGTKEVRISLDDGTVRTVRMRLR